MIGALNDRHVLYCHVIEPRCVSRNEEHRRNVRLPLPPLAGTRTHPFFLVLASNINAVLLMVDEVVWDAVPLG
ncbi:hypothetical protein E2562_021738 [Oryza meyeriana var. granulata]|uniref:Uncharacterized protein n=1 Tax=Oryza meyeriana var. granulata TaxID=110450 RepID=A0A6G1E032_9ORYZ|nr:hypothetical protein E2562_021738 [Oryza meyeriana var. granulata]